MENLQSLNQIQGFFKFLAKINKIIILLKMNEDKQNSHASISETYLVGKM